MRLAILCCLLPIGMPAVEIEARARQGTTLHVRSADGAAKAVFGGRTYPVYAGEALLPVPIDHAPGRAEVKILKADGGVLHRSEVEILEGGYPEQNVTVTGSMKALKATPAERTAIDQLKALATPVRHWQEPFLAPTRGCMNSPYGVKRLHNGKPSGRYHLGLDQRGPTGTLVRAPAAGIVRVSRMFKLHGGTVGIDHGQGVTTMFIHLSAAVAKEGARVKAGQVIGKIGATGFANGPHLHWIVNVHGTPVNPLQWAPAIQPCAVKR